MNGNAPRIADLTVLVIGGYGTFGGRLCTLLADEARLTLIVAGRSLAKAQAFCRQPSKARLVPATFDRDGDVAGQIAGLAPAIVVDASGPWQAYAGAPYAVVRGALAAGADYLDLADGSAFVSGIGAFDDEAQRAGRFVLSGVSSFPVLTAAAVSAIAGDLARIDTIRAGIAPSPYAGVGLNVIRAIASYAGQPVRLLRGGQLLEGVGMVDSIRYTVTVPGRVPLPRLRFALVDVPDLTALPLAFPSVGDIFTGAAPTPRVLHGLLRALAWLVHRGLLPSLLPFVPLMNWVTNHVRWGEHRGGMFVAVGGVDAAGQPAERCWHMLAEGDAGPLIPSMALEILIRACLAGRRPSSGARPALGSVTLADYEARFRARGIASARLAPPDPGAPLYRQLLGAAYDTLAAPLRDVHDIAASRAFRGEADVTRGGGRLARLVARITGFPPAGERVPVTVTLTRSGSRELWQRDFAGHRFASVQVLGSGAGEGLLVERFGPLAFAMAVVVEDGRLRLIQRRWSAFGIPMPRWLLPRGEAYEHDAGGRFNFHVDVVLPFVGPVVGYRGWLKPA
jgi:hypothetical protein